MDYLWRNTTLLIIYKKKDATGVFETIKLDGFTYIHGGSRTTVSVSILQLLWFFVTEIVEFGKISIT